MKLQLSYAVSPVSINQPFGANPDYYARFHDSAGNPEKGHMGVDFMAAHATPLYAPCDGTARYASDDHGGEGIYLNTTDGEGNWYNVILWHLCGKNDAQYHPRIPLDGSGVQVTRGQLIGYTDNTGAPFESSGDHLHFGLVPVNQQNTQTLSPNNGFNGCIDPMPFFPPTPVQQAIITNVGTIIAEVAAMPKGQQTKFFASLARLLGTIKTIFS